MRGTIGSIGQREAVPVSAARPAAPIMRDAARAEEPGYPRFMLNHIHRQSRSLAMSVSVQ